MPDPQPSARIEALLEAMTLEEKIGQMTLVSAGWAVTGPQVSGDYMAAVRAGRIGAISNLWGAQETRAVQRVAVEETRLRIPLLFAFDVIHGHRTIFPIPLAEAAAFDPVLWERTARAAAIEAAADGLNLIFAPMLDVARDPRWGRIAESPGEDPWVAARFAEAKVRGFEGDDIAHPQNLAATAKHLAAYGASVAGRDYAAVDVSEWSFHEVYLPPFRAAVAAGVAAIMPAFTDLAGVPMTANSAVLRKTVRERWRFDGLIVSDHGAIRELLAHGVAGDAAEAAALALRAGVDIDLMSGAYGSGLPLALERGLVSVAQIDAAVRRVLALKARLGLFDDPFHRSDAALAPPGQAEMHRDLARDAARRSIVLLINRDGLLPLQAAMRRIAVIGPLADARDDMLGPWAAAGRAEDMVTIIEGLREALPGSADQPCAGRRDRRRRGGRHWRRPGARTRSRCRGALPGRGAGDERGGGKSRAARSARPPAGTRAGGAGPRQACSRASVVWSPPPRAVAVRARAGRARDLVSRQRGGSRHW